MVWVGFLPLLSFFCQARSDIEENVRLFDGVCLKGNPDIAFEMFDLVPRDGFSFGPCLETNFGYNNVRLS